MSKQSDAKASQGYVDKVVPASCSNCVHCEPVMNMVLVYVDSMDRSKGTHKAPVQTGQACGIGGFKVKKLGCCRVHIPAPQPASSTAATATPAAA